MKKASILLVSAWLLRPICMEAQDFPPVHLPETEVRTITSTIVGGYEYGVWVALPEGYYESFEVYPVVYVLDATNQFATVVQAYRLLRAFDEVPPMLLVGVAHTDDFIADRARDFFPTHISPDEVGERYGPGMANFIPMSGGAGAFLRVLRSEIIPFIEAEYRGDSSNRGIFGHSAAGLFVLYTLFNEPDLFERYLAASSAVWWDEFAVLDDEAKYASQHEDLHVKLLATVGSDEGDLIVGGWERLQERIQTRNYESLDFTALMMDGESHVSVVPRTYSRALRVLFGTN